MYNLSIGRVELFTVEMITDTKVKMSFEYFKVFLAVM